MRRYLNGGWKVNKVRHWRPEQAVRPANDFLAAAEGGKPSKRSEREGQPSAQSSGLPTGQFIQGISSRLGLSPVLLAVLAGTLLLATIPPGLLVLGRLDRARAAKQFREEFDRAVRVAPFLRDSSAPDRADALEAWKSRVHASGIPLGDMGLSSDDVEAWIASAKSRRAELALDAVIGRLPALEGDLKGIRAEIDRLAEYRAVESRDREIARLRKSVDEVRGKIPRGTESDARVARVLQLASELTEQADLAARLTVAPMTAEEIERMRQAEQYVRERVQRALYRGVAISFSDVDLMVRGNRFVVSGSFEVHVTGDTWTSASWFVVTFEGDRVSIDGDSSWAK